MARVHAHPRSMGPEMDSLSLRYFGLALVDPTDRYLRAWKPVPSCLQFDQQRVLSRFFSFLLPLLTAAPLGKTGEPTGPSSAYMYRFYRFSSYCYRPTSGSSYASSCSRHVHRAIGVALFPSLLP
jgi:hypothetical protein